MISEDVLDLEIRFLVARYGPKRVNDALARIGESHDRELREKVTKFEGERRTHRSKKRATATEIAASSELPETSKALLLSLAKAFDDGLFLPNLRDVDRFLAKQGMEKPPRSRREAAGSVVRILRLLSPDGLRALHDELNVHSGESEYHRLAHQIMGRRNA